MWVRGVLYRGEEKCMLDLSFGDEIVYMIWSGDCKLSSKDKTVPSHDYL